MVRSAALLGMSVGLLLGASEAAVGQDASRAPEDGSYGVFFDLPSGGGTGFGLRKMLSPSANLGLGILVDYRWDERERTGEPTRSGEIWRIGVRPDVRLYKGGTGSVLPFLALAAEAAFTENDEGPFSRSGLDLGGSVGIGAEWFPVSGMSVSGSTGAEVVFRRQDLDPETSSRSFVLRLFRSALAFNLYF